MEDENVLDITLNLNEICRVCLSKHETMHSIYNLLQIDDKDFEEIRYINEILSEISSIKVNEDDGLPNMICPKCIENAQITYIFKKQFNKSQLILEKYLLRTQLLLLQSQQSPTVQNCDDNDYDESNNVEEITNFDEVPLKLEITIDENQHFNKTIKQETVKETDSKKTSESSGDKTVDKQSNVIDQHCKRVKFKNKKLKNDTKDDLSYFTEIDELGAKIYKCSLCEKSYPHCRSIRNHMRFHKNDYPHMCGTCGKSYKNYSSLSYHNRSHSDEQPYACELCDKKYKQAGALTAHMRVHTGQRPFLCSICGRNFRQGSDLTYHMRIHTKEKRYMCNICGKTMTMQSHLTEHMRSHTGERPFKCSICNKCFSRSTTLNRHLIMHSGIKPFTCDVCNKSFNVSSRLKVHYKTHSDERPYTCHICNKGFVEAHALRSHIKIHSSKNVCEQIEVILPPE